MADQPKPMPSQPNPPAKPTAADMIRNSRESDWLALKARSPKK
jgi:hypothetical protein